MSPDLKDHLITLMWTNALDLQPLLTKQPGSSQQDYLSDINSVAARCHMHCRVIHELGCHNDAHYGSMYDRIDAIATRAGELLQEIE